MQSYCFAQTTTLSKQLLGYTSSLDSLSKMSLTEKLYLQFDKPYYAIGDTIWFKAYLLNSTFLTASNKSGIIYVDIANDSNKVVMQFRLPVFSGLSWGNISISDKDFASGTYTIRAYTRWMLNQGDEAFFYKRFYISNQNESTWLINTKFSTSIMNGSNTANARILFTDINRTPFAVQSLQLQVLNGGRQLYKQKVQTGVDGVLDVNFKIPQKVLDLELVVQSESGQQKAIIPANLNRPENADVQFLAEGGNQIAGLPAHVGFKAIGEDGRGINITGVIIDHLQRQVAVFKTLYTGIGSFDFAAKKGESYIAKVTLPGGLVKDYNLPQIQSSGTALHIKNELESDSVEVSVTATNDLAQSGENYYLIGKSRGIVCYAAVVNLHETGYLNRKISKHLFPSGIAHFCLMTTKYQPLNERLVFMDNHDDLKISVTANKPFFGSRDSVKLYLTAKDKEGNPIRGNFSIAVTDNQQVKTDTLNNENIISHLLLTSELKGYVEEPGYYLMSKTAGTWKALDNLLLTQGWIGYNWQQAINPPVFNYKPEQEFEVSGNVSNVLNTPVKGSHVILLSKSPVILMDTTTNIKGQFTFRHFPGVDTPLFVIKAVNKSGKSFNVKIKMDEVKVPGFVRPFSPLIMPWYVNADSTLLNYNKTIALKELKGNFPAGGHILKEVKINAKKIVKDSQNLNGSGNADQVVDKVQVEEAGKLNWLQLFEQKIKGFRAGTTRINQRSFEWYFIKDKWARIFVDGVEIDPVIDHPLKPYVLNFTLYLESKSAEDIKGIEVNTTSKFVSNYERRFGAYPDATRLQYAFIEVTSRYGQGPLFGSTPGVYLYKPLPFVYPKQFYKPKYIIKDTSVRLSDLRSTIDWEPNIITNKDGKATVSFYSADTPSTYTIIVEGTDMNGNLGYESTKIIVKDQKKTKKDQTK